MIANLARCQRGRVGRAQLLAVGITPDAIKHRVRSGRLITEHEGVYAVGYRTNDQLGRWTSALLAVGDDAALSHLASGAAWGLVADPVVVDITCPRKLQSRRGIRLHHHTLGPRDVRQL